MPRATLVVAAYNVERYLSRCLDSVLEQTTRDIEVIVVDDGSTDATGDIADGYAELDRRLKVVHQANGGLSAARNAGLRSAHGDFIVFVDGDDWIDPLLVQRMTDRAKASSSDVVVAGCHVDTHDGADRLLRSTVQLPRRIVLDKERLLRRGEADSVLVNLVGYAWNKLYRTELLVRDAIEFEEGLSLVEDVVFNALALTHASRVAFIDEALAHYVQRPRTTLGTHPYPDVLSLRLRAIRAVDQVLAHWGVEESELARRRSAMGVAAVVGAVRSVATRTDLPPGHRMRALQTMLEQPDGISILRLAQLLPSPRSRDRVILGLLSKTRYRLALLPYQVTYRLRGLRQSLRGLVPAVHESKRPEEVQVAVGQRAEPATPVEQPTQLLPPDEWAQ